MHVNYPGSINKLKTRVNEEMLSLVDTFQRVIGSFF